MMPPWRMRPSTSSLRCGHLVGCSSPHQPAALLSPRPPACAARPNATRCCRPACRQPGAGRQSLEAPPAKPPLHQPRKTISSGHFTLSSSRSGRVQRKAAVSAVGFDGGTRMGYDVHPCPLAPYPASRRPQIKSISLPRRHPLPCALLPAETYSGGEGADRQG